MANTEGNGVNNITMTTSTPTQPNDIPEPRSLDLPRKEYHLYLDYVDHVHQYRGKPVSRGQAVRKNTVLKRMTDEQKKTFPLLAEEEDIIVVMEDAKDLKDDLEELAHQLKLEADNEIDVERGRT